MDAIKNFDNPFGRDAGYSKKDRGLYEELMESSLSPFKDKNMFDIFVHAAVYGFVRAKHRDKLRERQSNIRVDGLKPEQRAILLTIAIAEGGIEVLFNDSEVLNIVEEYANAGIRHLKSLQEGSDGVDSIIKMSSEMRKIARQINSGHTG